MEHPNGTYFDRTFGPFYNQDYTLATWIGSATKVIFAIKNKRDDADSAALVLATLTSGITVNGTAATVRVQIPAADMNIGEGDYYMGMGAIDAGGYKRKLALTENGYEIDKITITKNIADCS